MKTLLRIIVIILSVNFYGQTKQQKIEFLVNELGYFNSIKSTLFEYHIENLKNSGHENDVRVKNLESKLSDKEILKRLSNAYSGTFTEKEIDEIYKFYSSETGKKYAESQNVVQYNIKENFNEIFQEINRIQEDYQEKQTKQSSYLTTFFDSEFEKPNGFYLVTEHKINKGESNLELENNASFTPNDIEEIKSSYNDLGNLLIDIQFKESSVKRLKNITANNINKGMAIIVDKKIITMPVIFSEITDGKMQISGNFTVEEIKNIVQKLKK